jgi:LAO/AO transport system kinase
MAATNFRNALHFFPKPDSGWLPQVLCYSGFYGTGVKEIWDMIYEYIDFVKQNGYFDYRRTRQAKYWMYETIHSELLNGFYQNPVMEKLIPEMEQQVLDNKISSFVAAHQLLDTYAALQH